ncbi:hypothetical protein scyTo_0019729 [Scyliorhinus torazame]|uniref:Uncharacterized protein n=1 Tax=Scyliorhinus torazame TaxID=75743 RepID=A0A401PPS0_SCYTO|nr:hypothetical protein [Scyliorhinus torazame]
MVRRSQTWVLTDTPYARHCVSNNPTGPTVRPVGTSPCEYTKTFDQDGNTDWYPSVPASYWNQENDTRSPLCNQTRPGLWKCLAYNENPYVGVPGLKHWGNASTGGPAPEGLFWICGDRGYSILPLKWRGTCSLGFIQPGFFLLPKDGGDTLGIRVLANLTMGARTKRNLQIGDWKDDEWPPERIISYYGPATWAEDGSWGYRTPIYILNRLIHLQAVLEIITNRTADALDLLARQQTQMRAGRYIKID